MQVTDLIAGPRAAGPARPEPAGGRGGREGADFESVLEGDRRVGRRKADDASTLPPEAEQRSPDAPEGEYYVVAEIDYDDDISERDEFNNMAVWNRKLEVVDACDCTSVAGSRTGGGSLAGIGLFALVLILRRRAT